MDRSKVIIRTSIIGIFLNLLLILFKLAVGVLSNSIAIILDAVNNMGDALSSIITIIGTRLAGKAPDKKHPYGYGRIEYLASVLISVIVLVAGITSLRESVDKILHPEEASYSVVTLIILILAVIVKFVWGRHMKKTGESIHAQTLVASGTDSFFDAILSFATFVAAIINMLWGIGLEGILGVVISIIIIKAGFQMLLETLDSIIGTRADADLSKTLKEKIGSYGGVLGAYDLALHNYGPMELIGSVHIEVADTMTAKEIHGLTRQIAIDIYNEFGMILTVGIYASNTSEEEILAIKKDAAKIVEGEPLILQMHGFYGDSETKSVTFDLVFDFDADAEELQAKVEKRLSGLYPAYHFYVVVDSDYSD